jgi:hypothetical protein
MAKTNSQAPEPSYKQLALRLAGDTVCIGVGLCVWGLLIVGRNLSGRKKRAFASTRQIGG